MHLVVEEGSTIHASLWDLRGLLSLMTDHTLEGFQSIHHLVVGTMIAQELLKLVVRGMAKIPMQSGDGSHGLTGGLWMKLLQRASWW